MANKDRTYGLLAGLGLLGFALSSRGEGPDNETPIASLSVSSSERQNGTLVVQADASGSSDPDGSIAEYQWGMTDPDGNPMQFSQSGSSIEVEVPGPGTYTVVVTVKDDAGATDRMESAVTVGYEFPNPTLSLELLDSRTIRADASGSNDPDGQIVKYTLFWGDGNQRVFNQNSPPTANHQYSTGGTKQVSLVVEDGDGQTAEITSSLSLPVEPPNERPSASVTASTDGLTVTAECSASDSDGSVASYDWAYVDDTQRTTLGVTGPSVTFDVPSSGTYAIECTVTDNDGATRTVADTVSAQEKVGLQAVLDAQPNEDFGDVTLNACDSTGDIAGYRFWVYDSAGSVVADTTGLACGPTLPLPGDGEYTGEVQIEGTGGKTDTATDVFTLGN